MRKDRLGAFMDAIIAIVMTVLVLELPKPADPTLSAFTALGTHYAVYALSFLWLGSMWVSLHNAWDRAELISGRTIGISMLLLFFSSFIPYLSSLVGQWIGSAAVEGFYGLDILLTTLTMMWLYHSLDLDNVGRACAVVTGMKPANRAGMPAANRAGMQAGSGSVDGAESDGESPETCDIHLYLTGVQRTLIPDVIIKLVTLVIGVLFWPPLVSIGILAAAGYIACRKFAGK